MGPHSSQNQPPRRLGRRWRWNRLRRSAVAYPVTPTPAKRHARRARFPSRLGTTGAGTKIAAAYARSLGVKVALADGSGSIFHPARVICGPFNRLALQQHGGPHGNWGGPAARLDVRRLPWIGPE